MLFVCFIIWRRDPLNWRGHPIEPPPRAQPKAVLVAVPRRVMIPVTIVQPDRSVGVAYPYAPRYHERSASAGSSASFDFRCVRPQPTGQCGGAAAARLQLPRAACPWLQSLHRTMHVVPAVHLAPRSSRPLPSAPAEPAPPHSPPALPSQRAHCRGQRKVRAPLERPQPGPERGQRQQHATLAGPAQPAARLRRVTGRAGAAGGPGAGARRVAGAQPARRATNSD